MKLFLTGASGFIGAPFCHKLLGQGYEVLALSRSDHPIRPGLTWLQGDLADPDSYREAVARFAPDAIAHLAWEGLPDYSEEQCEKNVEQATQLFQLGADIGCRTLLAAGSCWEYAQATGPVTEATAHDDTKPFTRAKNELRLLGERLAREKGLRFIWPRLFFIYGPGQKSNSLIPMVMERLGSGLTVELKTPDAVQDFLFITDAAEALCALLEKAPAQGGLYNVGSGIPARVGDVASVVAREMGMAGLAPEINDETLIEKGFWANMRRITSATGWRPRFDLSEGVRLTVLAKRNERRDMLK